MGNKQNKTTNNKSNKSFTLCPLIDKRKIIVEKKIASNMISALTVINYKNKEFIGIGYTYGKIEIFDSENLESVAMDNEEIRMDEYIRYMGQLPCGDFIVASEDYIRIYFFYFYNGNNSYCIDLIQKIGTKDMGTEGKYFERTREFSKAFNFDRSLYREYDDYQMEKDRIERRENEYYKPNLPIDKELIISGNFGLFIFEKSKKKKQKNCCDNIYDYNNEENNNETDSEDCDNNNNKINEEENKNENENIDIIEYINEKKKSLYEYKYQITNLDNYDSIQVNFKYLAGTAEKSLILYSIDTKEIVTKFDVRISEHCDSVIFMLTYDILVVAGNDHISLISIKDSDIILTRRIKFGYKITEICILPDYNLLLGMQKNDSLIQDKHMEYFYQYKVFHKVNKEAKKMEYDILKVGERLLTKNYSNITMRCLSEDRIVIIIDLEHIQILK